MALEEQNKDDTVKGFAGLSSLLSDVDDIVTSEKNSDTELSNESSYTEQAKHQPKNNSESSPEAYRRTQAPSSDFSRNIKLVYICAFILFIWLLVKINEKDNKIFKPAPTYSNSLEVESTPYLVNKSLQSDNKPSASNRPSEEKPAAGINLNLSTAQIRYCLAEDIRIKGAESTIDNRFESDVARFNVMVGDYNSRCGHFRYRNGTLESAKTTIEPYRAIIEAEGRYLFAQSTALESEQSFAVPVSPQSKNTVSDLQADNIILELQERLNKLGYDAGRVDGHAGNKTRNAIIDVQKALGIPVNGIASASLLKQLDNVSQRTNTKVTVKPTPLDGIISPAIQEQPLSISQAHQGKPDLSGASPSEQQAIEKSCNYDRTSNGPASYYDCLNRELKGLFRR